MTYLHLLLIVAGVCVIWLGLAAIFDAVFHGDGDAVGLLTMLGVVLLIAPVGSALIWAGLPN